jgi:tRNA dimethylallyltransferase
VLAIVGPTASGKTDMAISVALELGAEIISVDSMQVYRGMNIGTAKPTLIERRGVLHHMIDIADPSEDFTVAEFRRRGKEVMKSVDTRLIITGGSGLHFRSLVDPMSFAPTDAGLRAELEAAHPEDLVGELVEIDPEAGEQVDLANLRRVIRAVEIARLTGETPSSRAATEEAEDIRRYRAEVGFTAVGLDPGEELDQRVEHRLRAMRSGGLLQEVIGLRGRMGRTARAAVGYREVLAHLDGEMTEDEAFEEAARNTKRLAKKQRTWFQRDPRIRWIPWSDDVDQRTERALEALT